MFIISHFEYFHIISFQVFITMKGSRDVLYKTRLAKKTSNFSFMRNTKESFFLKGPRLGNLEIITIEVYTHFKVAEVSENHGTCDE